MEPWNLSITRNPLRTRGDLVDSLASLIKPLLRRFVRGNTGLHIGNTAAHYDEVVALLEGESRLLWGLAPYAAGTRAENAVIEKAVERVVHGLKTGPDPRSPWYWGVGGDREQRYVEMAAIAFSLLLAPETFWKPLSGIQRQNLASWLAEINGVELPPTNWEFFRVLVNVALKRVGAAFDLARLTFSLDLIEGLYREDGWYIDETNFDLYNPFAFHFYGLVYARIVGDEDPQRADLFRSRARLFSRQFLPWFTEEGASVPFGRSLCYRFAVSSFFAACAFAGEEVLPWGVLKGIILRNLRWWFRQPIFDHEGLLTIGYGYPNLIMAEQYNAPGSPYWALKTYLLLAMPETHPFWTSKEEDLPPLPEISHNAPPHLLLCTKKACGMRHTYLVNAGQYPCWESVHAAAKYAKFAYSADFGFCVSHGAYDLSKTGCDSSLVLSEGDGYWRERRQCVDRFSCTDYVYSRWFPWPDVEVRSWILPCGFWNIRIHAIVSDRALETAEGGYSLPDNSGPGALMRPAVSRSGVHGIFARFPWACGGILDLLGNRKAELHKPEPNLNILYPKVLIPLLRGRIIRGKSFLASAVFAARGGSDIRGLWESPPNVALDIEKARFVVEYEDRRIVVDMRRQGDLR